MLDLLKPIIGTPEAMLFLTVALGVLLGRQKIAGFSFGNAAGTLIVGTFLGAIFGGAVPDLSPTLKSVAFLLFVFAVGFQSGPQFFASLGRSTLPQALIAVVVAAVGLVTTAIVARLLDLDQGIAIGVAAGGLTQTAMLGTAYGALNELGLSAEALRKIQGDAAVAFALTYVFGTIGVVLFCSQIGPRLIGINLKDAARDLEASQAKALNGEGDLLDFRSLVARVFQVDAADGKTIAGLETAFGPQVAVQRVRRSRKDLVVVPDLVLRRGDLVAIEGYRPAIVKVASQIGQEVAAEELVTDLLGNGADVIIKPSFAGLTLRDAVAKLGAGGHGLFLRRIRRQSHDIPVTAQTVLLPGDTLSLAGPADRLAAALPQIGTPASTNNRSDVAFLAAGLLLGVLIGLLTLNIAGLPITLSAGGGALVAGLIFGWWHARRPERSNVPLAATQIMWDFGLASFCALVGLTAGPQAVSAMGSHGATLLLAGAIVTLVPQIVGLFVGHFILKINPVLLMGALAGAQTQDAAMLAASDVAESPAPALGFTVPYAIGNILLTILGPGVVALT
ncbi:transporter [Mesorhizobium sp. NPDC059025]|uniref:aspartate-alanine antiporter-like transporter n=1 Tax=unclassified Mesorhizobium TaxID=325217 RepID=UPI00366E1E52